jgi:3-oxoacyl-[acyl-carrier protein] reductase
MDLKLKGKKALVMGSSSGLGRAVAESLIEEGAEVVLCSRSEDRLQKAVKEIGAKAGFVCDLTKAGEVLKLIAKTSETLGGIDILVTNTGGPQKGQFFEVTNDQWHTDFQSLWMSVVESLRAVLPAMQKQKFGRVLMITSLAAKEPMSGLTTSNGLRAGLAGLAKSIANEVAADGVTINLLLPGYTATDRLKDLKLSPEKIQQMVPAGRLGDPRELADLACFLASPRAGYITGQSIAVDGGVLRGNT